MPSRPAEKPAIKVPKALGACADRLGKIKEEKGKLNRAIELLDQEESAIKNKLILELPKGEAAGVIGKHFKAVVGTKEIPTPEDWELIYKRILETQDFSLLQRRLMESTVRDHWEQGETIPGVGKFTATVVSVTKA